MQNPLIPSLIAIVSLVCVSCRHGSSASDPDPAPPSTSGDSSMLEAQCIQSFQRLYSHAARNLTLNQKGSQLSNADYLVGLAVASGKMDDSCLEFHYLD